MKLSRKQWIPIGILLLFIITNPSISSFKAYIGDTKYDHLSRPANLFLFSVYEDDFNEYVGVFGNFLQLPEHHNTHQDSVEMKIMPDSSLAMDSLSRGLKKWTPPSSDKEVIGKTSDGLHIFKK